MKSEALRALQAPLKEQYREEPESALVTFRAEGRALDDISCHVETARGAVVFGLHPAAGGDGTFTCSADMMLEALVGCAGVTLRAVATAMGITLRDVRITASGELDFRGTLGVSREAPVGFKTIRLHVELDTDADEAARATLIRLTERYCVVFQTLRNPPEITVS